MIDAENRKRQEAEAPSRRYADAKAASAGAADRIAQASLDLVKTFREVYSDSYKRPHEAPIRMART